MPWQAPPHDPARELREHLPSAGWRAAAEAILARHGLTSAGLAPFASGSDVVWGTPDAVLKLTAPCFAHEIAAEEHWQRAVRSRLSVRAPEPLARGELDGWPYLVMTRVPGVALAAAWRELDARERARLAGALGEFVAELHALALPEGEHAGRGASPWASFWRACRGGVAERHARAGVPEQLLHGIEPFLQRIGALETGPLVLLHTELLGEHVLVEQRAGRLELCALIDWADARLGAPDYEHAAPVEFLFRGEPGLLARYLDAYEASGGILHARSAEQRLAWALSHRFASLARMLAAVAPRTPSSLEELAAALYSD